MKLRRFLKTKKCRRVKLGGKVYELPPLTLGELMKIEKELGCGITQLGEKVGEVSTLYKILCVVMRDKYPEITPEYLRGLSLNIRDIGTIAYSIFNM